MNLTRICSSARVGGKEIKLVNIKEMAGYHLDNLSDWNEYLASAIALPEGIELTPQHWKILLLLRKYYNEYQIVLGARVFSKLQKHAGLNLDLEILPKGVDQACGLAGLPYPAFHCAIRYRLNKE